MQAKFLIIESQAGVRLDKFLAENLPEFSRAEVQKWIKGGGAKINGQEVTAPHRFLKKDDQVEVTTVVLKKNEIASSLRGVASRNNSAEPSTQDDEVMPLNNSRHDIKVIAEEPDYIVLEKPAGLLAHGTSKNESHTLAHWIVEHYPECATVGDKPDVRPGMVHRLDKDASGLMVVARTQEFFDALKQQFKMREIEKEYRALVHGKLADDAGVIDFPIARSTQEARMSARPVSQGGKEARTEYEVAERYTIATLLRVFPKTGRTHQIRVHFFALGYPLIGDPLYFRKKDKRLLDQKLGRLFLHATRIRFADITGNEVEYVSELPEKLSAFLSTLKVRL